MLIRSCLSSVVVSILSGLPNVAAVSSSSARNLLVERLSNASDFGFADAATASATATGCPHSCSGHGSCALPTGVCTCFSGFEGKACDIESASTCTESCHGHGWCVRGSLCLCEEYWRGEMCELPAPCPNQCSGAGKCVRDKCICDAAHKGTDCSIPSGANCPGWPSVCGGVERGVCTDAGACKCGAAFGGKACELLAEELLCPLAYDDEGMPLNGTCSSHGRCENAGGKSRGQCVCDDGWAGDACERPANELPLDTILLLVGLGVFTWVLGLVGLLAYCVVVRGVLLHELLRGRWKRVTKEEGWRHCEVEGMADGARFERFFGDLNDFEALAAAERTMQEQRRSGAAGPR